MTYNAKDGIQYPYKESQSDYYYRKYGKYTIDSDAKKKFELKTFIEVGSEIGYVIGGISGLIAGFIEFGILGAVLFAVLFAIAGAVIGGIYGFILIIIVFMLPVGLLSFLLNLF